MRGGNGDRLMHDDCPYYANELQQPLSYVPQNELWLALMAKFCIGQCKKLNTLIPLQQSKAIDQAVRCILFILLRPYFSISSCPYDNTFNG